MATRTISDAGGNWNDTATWVEGVVPVSSDDIVATGTSGNLTINVATAAVGIDYTNYVGTLTVNHTMVINNNKNLTLVSGMTITTSAGTPLLQCNGTTTLTSNGKTWPYAITFFNTATATLADSWTVTGNCTINNTRTFDGNTLNLGGNFTPGTGGVLGTTNIVLNGTGTWSGAGAVKNNLTINTAGTITIGTNVSYNTGTLTYTAGTVVTTGSLLNLSASCTLDTNGITWNDISINASMTITLNSLLSVSGLFSSTQWNLTFAGTAGFSLASLLVTNNSSATRTITLTAGNTYDVTTNLRITTSQSTITLTDIFTVITSSDGTNTVALNLTAGATQAVSYCNSTRIDSSGGDPILFFKGTSTDCVNWTEAGGGGGGPLPMVTFVKS